MSSAGGDPFEGREPRRYEARFRVTEDDIDDLGHVNNVVYVDWIQRAAGEHWRAAADRELQERVAWVVSRHEIDYKRPAHAGEEITARTWVGSATAVRFERHCEILDAAGRTLARSRTIWSPLDRETGRLMRLDPAAHEPFYHDQSE